MPAAPRPSRAQVDEIAAFLAAAGVASGARILDVPCGIGRRAHGLAEHGFRMTAVDANPVAIEALRRRAPKDLRARMECRSAAREAMPDLPADEHFDVILCLDHAIGRAPEDEDRAFLARLAAHLAPGGFLLLDTLHRDYFAARPRPFACHVLGEVEQHEFRRFDPVTGVLDLTWKFYQRDAKDLRFQGASSARMRLLAPHETEEILRAAGWRVEAWYGGWGKEAVSADRRKLLLVARPAAELNSVTAFVTRASSGAPDAPRTPGKEA